jgi:Myb-like DNA-binding domain
MPKTIRASGTQGYYREDPHQTYYSNISTSQTGMQPQAMSPMPPYPSSNSLSQQPQYHSVPQSAPVSLRASSGAWAPADDQTLMQARASGLNWAPIQAQYFPSKTPNACRKRHERLMDRRNTDDWEQTKLENLAKEYMSMRREIWAPLASRTGEKWTTVESKVCLFSIHLQTQTHAQ